MYKYAHIYKNADLVQNCKDVINYYGQCRALLWYTEPFNVSIELEELRYLCYLFCAPDNKCLKNEFKIQPTTIHYVVRSDMGRVDVDQFRNSTECTVMHLYDISCSMQCRKFDGGVKSFLYYFYLVINKY